MTSAASFELHNVSDRETSCLGTCMENSPGFEVKGRECQATSTWCGRSAGIIILCNIAESTNPLRSCHFERLNSSRADVPTGIGAFRSDDMRMNLRLGILKLR